MRQLDEMLSSEAVTLVRVLEQIRREGPISQIEIGQRLGLGRAAINIHVKKLQAQQIIIPVGSNDDQAMGRPRVLLDLNREGKAVLGISLDAPRLSGAIMDFSNVGPKSALFPGLITTDITACASAPEKS